MKQIWITEEDHKQLKILAAKKTKSMKEIIKGMLEEKIKNLNINNPEEAKKLFINTLLLCKEQKIPINYIEGAINKYRDNK